jgi:hypothetical protein
MNVTALRDMTLHMWQILTDVLEEHAAFIFRVEGMKITVFWIKMLCCRYHCFGGTCFLNLQGEIGVKEVVYKDAVGSSK